MATTTTTTQTLQSPAAQPSANPPRSKPKQTHIRHDSCMSFQPQQQHQQQHRNDPLLYPHSLHSTFPSTLKPHPLHPAKTYKPSNRPPTPPTPPPSPPQPTKPAGNSLLAALHHLARAAAALRSDPYLSAAAAAAMEEELWFFASATWGREYWVGTVEGEEVRMVARGKGMERTVFAGKWVRRAVEALVREGVEGEFGLDGRDLEGVWWGFGVGWG